MTMVHQVQYTMQVLSRMQWCVTDVKPELVILRRLLHNLTVHVVDVSAAAAAAATAAGNARAMADADGAADAGWCLLAS